MSNDKIIALSELRRNDLIDRALRAVTGGYPQWASFNQGTWARSYVDAGLITGTESELELGAMWDAWSREHDA